MGFFSKIFGKKPVPQKPSPQEPAVDTLTLSGLVSYLQGATGKPCIHITPAAAEPGALSLTDSKFGGLPYWPADQAYPCASNGEPLVLLAQINFSTCGFTLPQLPRMGLLQFFIAADDSYGMSFKNDTEQDTFRVVYHEAIDGNVTPESVRAMGARSCTDLDQRIDAFPFYKEFALAFEETRDPISTNDADFEDKIKLAYLMVTGKAMEQPPFNHFSNEEYIFLDQHLNGFGNKLLGYPGFTQEDPRGGSRYPLERYNTLLLQIDSDCKDILWGDSGVANFFIDDKALANCDFSDVLYNWDCY